MQLFPQTHNTTVSEQNSSAEAQAINHDLSIKSNPFTRASLNTPLTQLLAGFYEVQVIFKVLFDPCLTCTIKRKISCRWNWFKF